MFSLDRLTKLFGRQGTAPEPAAFEPEPYNPEAVAAEHFRQAVAQRPPTAVLEVGTLQAVPGVSTVSRHLFALHPPEKYVCLDIAPGADVDVVGDLHALSDDWTDKFDAFVAFAVFEHLERPWIAAREVARVLKPGGRFLVSTHQCFPIHAYPNDFFRFSRDALRLIFEDAGLVVDVCDYQNRATVILPDTLLARHERQNWNRMFPSYTHVEASGYKAG